jgi:hypothetical protein
MERSETGAQVARKTDYAREVAHTATPTCGNRPDAYKVSRPHSPACDRLTDSIAAALRSMAEETRERCAALIDQNEEFQEIGRLNPGRRGVETRTEGNQSGLGYAAAIRSLPLPGDQP